MAMRFILFTGLLISLIFNKSTLSAQESDSAKTFIKFEYVSYLGAVIKHREAMNEMENHPYFGQELRMSFQTLGSKSWHQLYNYPTYGGGFYFGNFNYDVIGKPKAVFGFMEFPFARKANSYFVTGWGAGISFNFNEYDSVSNPENIAIGSDVNVFIDFSLIYRHKISKKFELGAGIKLQHFSNGATAKPNLGINVAGGTLVLSYLPKTNNYTFKTTQEIPAFKKYEFTGMAATGIMGKDADGSKVKYMGYTASVSASKRLNYKRSVGLGFDYFYQEYLTDYYPEDKSLSASDLSSYAAFLGSDMIVDRFRISMQLGFYIYKPVDYGQFFYERVALRYYVTKTVFANVSIKAHAAKAEFIEWGLGYTF